MTYTVSESDLKRALGITGEITSATFQKHGAQIFGAMYPQGYPIPTVTGPTQLTLSVTETEDV